MSHKPLNIEELLEVMGSQEHIAHPEHRYELRRSLLCSRFFDEENARSSRWDRMLSYTAPLVAGGMMVGVFALMAVYAPVEPEVGPQTPYSRSPISQTNAVSVTDVAPLRVEDFLSDPSQPTVALAKFETTPTRSSFVPLASQSYVRTQ